MFCTYMDSRLPADPSFPDGRTFTGLHFLKTPDKPSKSHVQLICPLKSEGLVELKTKSSCIHSSRTKRGCTRRVATIDMWLYVREIVGITGRQANDGCHKWPLFAVLESLLISFSPFKGENCFKKSSVASSFLNIVWTVVHVSTWIIQKLKRTFYSIWYVMMLLFKGARKSDLCIYQSRLHPPHFKV